MISNPKHKAFFLWTVSILVILSAIVAFNWERINNCLKNMEKSSVLFSWEIGKETEQSLDTYQNRLNIDRVFQYIKPIEFSDGLLDEYVHEMKMRNLNVYAMDGGYYWGTTDYGYEELLSFVDCVYAYNISHDDNKIEGIVLDVEPAQDLEWRSNEDVIMKRFVNYMLQAYEYARKKDLKVVVCIPNWYDEKHENELRKLIEYGCDEIAVMNYSCGKEIDVIEKEVSIAEKYEKPIISIFEFAKPDNSVVLEQNTYYYKGVFAAEKVFKEMDLFFNYTELTVGWHQLNSFNK